VIALALDDLEFSEAYVEGEDGARWVSATGHGARASGSSVVRVGPGCHLPRHTDSAEETTFVAVYAAPEVVTRYEQEVQPDGSRERQTVG
jgi:hypothetical protein